MSNTAFHLINSNICYSPIFKDITCVVRLFVQLCVFIRRGEWHVYKGSSWWAYGPNRIYSFRGTTSDTFSYIKVTCCCCGYICGTICSGREVLLGSNGVSVNTCRTYFILPECLKRFEKIWKELISVSFNSLRGPIVQNNFLPTTIKYRKWIIVHLIFLLYYCCWRKTPVYAEKPHKNIIYQNCNGFSAEFYNYLI